VRASSIVCIFILSPKSFIVKTSFLVGMAGLPVGTARRQGEVAGVPVRPPAARGKTVEIAGLNTPSARIHGTLSGELNAGH
jgi:hypothetical protein